MIKDFEYYDDEYRDTGIIYKSMAEQVHKAWEKDPQLAGELAISFMELVLREDHEYSSDNMLIDMIMSGYKHTVGQAAKKYDKTVDVKKSNAVEKYRYREVILLKKAGVKGRDIVAQVGYKAPSNLTYHWNKICTEHIDLLRELWPEKALELEGAEGTPKETEGLVEAPNKANIEAPLTSEKAWTF